MSSSTVALIYAHPYAERSLANRELLAALDDLTFIDRRPIYDLYRTSTSMSRPNAGVSRPST